MLSLKEYSIRLSGGIVLFLIALGMLFPNRRITEELPGGTPLIVPIAMPLIAGPSALSMEFCCKPKSDLAGVVSDIDSLCLYDYHFVEFFNYFEIFGQAGFYGVGAFDGYAAHYAFCPDCAGQCEYILECKLNTFAKEIKMRRRTSCYLNPFTDFGFKKLLAQKKTRQLLINF